MLPISPQLLSPALRHPCLSHHRPCLILVTRGWEHSPPNNRDHAQTTCATLTSPPASRGGHPSLHPEGAPPPKVQEECTRGPVTEATSQ